MPLWGTVPQWIAAAGILVGLVGWAVKLWLGMGKLSSDERADIRGHTAKELAALRGRVSDMEKAATANAKEQMARDRETDERWRTLLRESEERHDECVAQRNALSDSFRDLDERFRGVVNQFIQFQVSSARVIPPADQSDAINQMIENLQPYLEPKK